MGAGEESTAKPSKSSSTTQVFPYYLPALFSFACPFSCMSLSSLFTLAGDTGNTCLSWLVRLHAGSGVYVSLVLSGFDFCWSSFYRWIVLITNASAAYLGLLCSWSHSTSLLCDNCCFPNPSSLFMGRPGKCSKLFGYMSLYFMEENLLIYNFVNFSSILWCHHMGLQSHIQLCILLGVFMLILAWQW